MNIANIPTENHDTHMPHWQTFFLGGTQNFSSNFEQNKKNRDEKDYVRHKAKWVIETGRQRDHQESYIFF